MACVVSTNPSNNQSDVTIVYHSLDIISSIKSLASQRAPAIRLVCELHKLTTTEYNNLLENADKWRSEQGLSRHDAISLSGGATLSWLYGGSSLEQSLIIVYLYELYRAAA